MTDVLGAPAPKKTSFREEANSPRIGRARFIGHCAGYAIIMALLTAGLVALHLTGPAAYIAEFPDKAILGGSVNLPYMGLHPWAAIGLAVIAALLWADLIVRRRHDRGRSGIDGLVWQALLLVSVGLHTFNVAPMVVGWLDLALVLGALYLIVVLVLLPGDKGPNRYGDDPRIIHPV